MPDGWRQHRGVATAITFHPVNPGVFVTVGGDGLVQCADTRSWGRGGGRGAGVGAGRGGGGTVGLWRSFDIGGHLTCVTLHHEVGPACRVRRNPTLWLWLWLWL